MRRWVLRITGLCAAVLAWHLLVSSLEPTPLPRPSDVVSSAWSNFRLLAEGAGYTTWRLIQGLTWGFLAATALAIASSRWMALRHLFGGPIEVVRPIPPIALTPFFILLLGLGDESQVGLIGLGAFMMFYVGWLEALRRTPDALLNSARSLGYDGLRLVLQVALPYAWPAQKPIWRLAIATGLSLSVAAEYLGAQGGLGFIIRNARTVLDFGEIAAASIALGGIAIAVDLVATEAIDFSSRWARKSGRFDV